MPIINLVYQTPTIKITENYKIVMRCQAPGSGWYNVQGWITNSEWWSWVSRIWFTSYYWSSNNIFVNWNGSWDNRIYTGNRSTWYIYELEFNANTWAATFTLKNWDGTSTLATSTATMSLTKEDMWLNFWWADRNYPGAIFDYVKVYNGWNLLFEDDFEWSTLNTDLWTWSWNWSYTISWWVISFTTSGSDSRITCKLPAPN